MVKKRKILNFILLSIILVSFIIILKNFYNLSDNNVKFSFNLDKITIDSIIIDAKGKEKNDSIGLITFENKEEIFIYDQPTSNNLQKGSGKINNKAILNEYGNNILLGHNDSFFKYLEYININSIIEIKTTSSALKYKVFDIYITKEDDYTPYKDSNDLILTLITCYPFNYSFNTDKRYIVVAKPF